MKPKKQGGKPASSKPKHLLQQLARTPEKLFSSAFRNQYGALCFRYKGDEGEIEILVITSRESGRWIVPKGWPMKGKEPHEAAAIEAWEEAGVRGKVRKVPFGRYTYLKELPDGKVAPCVVDMFQIEVKEVGAEFKERGQRRIDWVSPDEAARRVREIELKSLLVNFKPQRK
ncbi:8-oxo-dGTP pyrophosphatase MutT (NUDIX family) [Rhizobium sp. BK312]|uniref:NUDIX hydrolase n=1 Tax=Rhizobium sp. BK312 TaxID=2587080 RepID=UPI000DD68406|nr:NUDIX hydrolase [Rhizobium sp. BK312]MBB3424665.1 8-oxo-dGTP pyrophosphatase MutT (NUDIX family) [Rhizobium sp. BK312]